MAAQLNELTGEPALNELATKLSGVSIEEGEVNIP